eukprot:403369332
METSSLQCLNCSNSYNLDTQIPILMDCGHEICLDCYRNKLPQRQDGAFLCCFDNNHETKRRKIPMQNIRVIDKIKSLDVLRLACDKHNDLYSEYYCTQCDQIVCNMCRQLDHQFHNDNSFYKVNPENFKKYLNFINPLFDSQIEMITSLKTKFNILIDKSQILSSKDFISMMNQTKLILKDFVQTEDLPKLFMDFYELQSYNEPQDGIIKPKMSDINRQKYNIYESFQEQGNKYAGYYKQYLKLVNQELQKVSYSSISAYMRSWNNAELKLLYQGSRDGFEAKKFHQLCDNQGATIAFILSEYGYTFGGYTSVSWSSDGTQKEDRQAFLFQLNQRSIHPIEKNFDKAVYHNPGYHLTFGGGHDL